MIAAWTRRAFAAWALTALVGASPQDDAYQVLADTVAALSSDDPEAFYRGFDASYPDRDALRNEVEALRTLADLSSSVQPVENRGDELHPELVVDWLLHITLRSERNVVIRRRERVTVRFVKAKKGWRIQSLQPRSLFAPVQLA